MADETKHHVFVGSDERRWTLAKEITGTVIGMLPTLAAIIAFAGLLYSNVRVLETRVDKMEKAAEEQQRAASEQRKEVIQRIDQVGAQINDQNSRISELQRTVAVLVSRLDQQQQSRTRSPPIEQQRYSAPEVEQRIWRSPNRE